MELRARRGTLALQLRMQWRPCRLEAAPLKDATGWLEEYRRFWEESFDRLEVYLREVQAKKTREQKGRGGAKRRRKV